jgi:hypothetical protein
MIIIITKWRAITTMESNGIGQEGDREMGIQGKHNQLALVFYLPLAVP